MCVVFRIYVWKISFRFPSHTDLLCSNIFNILLLFSFDIQHHHYYYYFWACPSTSSFSLPRTNKKDSNITSFSMSFHLFLLLLVLRRQSLSSETNIILFNISVTHLRPDFCLKNVLLYTYMSIIILLKPNKKKHNIFYSFFENPVCYFTSTNFYNNIMMCFRYFYMQFSYELYATIVSGDSGCMLFYTMFMF